MAREVKRSPAGRRPHRVLAIGLVGTGLYVGGLGAGADAQGPAPTPSPVSETPVVSPTPAATPTPEPTPASTPVATSTPEPTPASTPVATSTPEPTPAPAPTMTPSPAPPPSPTATAAPPAPAHKHAPAALEPAAAHRRVTPRRRRPRRPSPAAAARPTPAPSPSPARAAGTPVPFAAPAPVVAGSAIPAFLLPIYHAAAARYGVPWTVLAAINEIETDFGRNLGPSSAGAVGWMQFLPSTWARYGVDANRDGVANPSDPADAVFAAARYLRAAGAARDLRGAVFAYNHAGWYVDAVLSRAHAIGALGYVPGLSRGRFPVRGHARYAGARTSLAIFAPTGAAVVAVHRGRVVAVGHTRLLGRFVRLRDDFGITYTYARLTGVRVRRSTKVRAGALLGRLGRTHMLFQIRPAGAARIAPAPILDGWRLGAGTLAARVLADRRLSIYACGRADIRAGAIDPRVLATLEYLADSGFDLTITSLRCGHSYLTTSGNVSEHSTGDAVDIAAVNGIPIAGHQGAGSITEAVIRRLLRLQGRLKPHQIISLMQIPGTDNTLALPDHADHIHVGFHPAPSGG